MVSITILSDYAFGAKHSNERGVTVQFAFYTFEMGKGLLVWLSPRWSLQVDGPIKRKAVAQPS
jgi:hypothetical protein